MPTPRFATLGLLCLTVATLAGQDARPAGDGSAGESPQSSFVTGAQYVRVDLYVTRDGRLLDDLRPDEIALFEDGVPQSIDTFERIVFRQPDPFDPAVEPRTLESSRALAADPRSRVSVVFVDRRRPPEFLERLLGTLESMLGPDDLVAVMTPDMHPDDLTFSRSLKGLAPSHAPLDEADLLYELCYPTVPGGPRDNPAGEMNARRHERMVLDALESLVTYLGGLREERKAVLLVSDGWRIYTPSPTLINSRRPPALPRPPLGGSGGPDAPGGTRIRIATHDGVWYGTDADREQCDADRAELASLDHRARLVEIAGHANRNNVSFYPVAPAGLTLGTTPFGVSVRNQPYENVTPLEMQASLRQLADQTDGYAIVNTNNFAGGFARMIADSSAYYLVGYQSTNAVLDGQYRRITVTVDRPGVAVRARPGYHATPLVLPDAPRSLESLVVDPVTAALSRMAAASERSTLRLVEAVWTAPQAAGAGGFWVVGEIDAAARREAGWGQGAAAEVVVQRADGAEVLDARLEVPAQHPSFALRVPAAGTLPTGDYTVRVRMAGSDARAGASEVIRVTVPANALTLGEAVLWRRGPFTGRQPVPTADPRFRRQEQLRLELPVFDDEPVTARLLDRTGALLPVPVAVSERHDDTETFRRVVLDLTLAPLAPGEYVVEATQGATRRVTAFRVVP